MDKKKINSMGMPLTTAQWCAIDQALIDARINENELWIEYFKNADQLKFISMFERVIFKLKIQRKK